MNTLRGGACLTLVVAAAVIYGSAGTAQGSGGTNFQATLPATVTAIGGNCCFLTADFAGSAVVPMLGRVTFTGGFVYLGTPGQTQPCELIFGEVPCEQRVFIELTAESGRGLTIRGDDFWEPPAVPGLWSWTATGDFTGSGTYSTTLISGTVTGEVGQPLTITLSGTLAPARSSRP
jgi:hypothetical protein